MSDDSTRAVVIGGNSDVLRVARSEGIPVILVHDSRRPNFDPDMPGLVEEFHDLDFHHNYAAVERCVLGLALHQPISTVLSLDEDGLVAAARLTAALGLSGNSVPTVHAAMHKPTMRAIMRRDRLPTLGFATCTSRAELLAAVAEFGGEAVAKPVDSTGSRDVHYVNPDNASAVFAELETAGYEQILVEERAHGHEFSIDTLTIGGSHFVIAVTRKHMVGRLEAGHSIPGELGEFADAAFDLVFNLLDALRVVSGAAHTEIMITDRGPAVIETQTRIGGSRLPELMRLASGIEITYLALLTAVGRLRRTGFALNVRPGAGGAAVRYFLPPAGRIVSIKGTEPFVRRPDLRLNFKSTVGDTVVKQTDSHQRNAVGMYVVAEGDSEKDAIRKCEEVLDAVTIEVEG
ncbi:ATP-grasp domain-containing protein [Streptomyces sp. NPDC004296]|uniref:ATP-grasp domain-containing protein n=1 Tax=Streptomyces sp. NPDC004296 TaxID=3364697 RepID=UPI00369CD09D